MQLWTHQQLHRGLRPHRGAVRAAAALRLAAVQHHNVVAPLAPLVPLVPLAVVAGMPLTAATGAL